jgi:hypothetical protein
LISSFFAVMRHNSPKSSMNGATVSPCSFIF